MAEYIEREAAIALASGGCHPANVAKEIAQLPAADVRPVVRGKWELDNFFAQPAAFRVMRCSECGHQKVPGHTYRFCPNCGAMMKGAEK